MGLYKTINPFIISEMVLNMSEIKMLTSLDKVKNVYTNMYLKDFNMDFIKPLLDNLDRYYAFYNRRYKKIIFNLGYIYENYSINIIDKIIETIIHETLHYILDNEINIDIDTNNSIGDNIHHTIIKDLGYFKEIKKDSHYNKDKYRCIT
jgi:hypothetical protein